MVELLSLIDHYLKEEQGKLGQLVASNVSIFAASNTDTSGCYDSEDASFQRCIAMDDELAERMDACQKRLNFLADFLSKVSAQIGRQSKFNLSFSILKEVNELGEG